MSCRSKALKALQTVERSISEINEVLALQVEAITRTLAGYGIEIVAVTDAAQNPMRQGHS